MNTIEQQAEEYCLIHAEKDWGLVYAAYLAGASAINGTVTGETSDGFHSFNELYEFRKVYNAALFNEWCSTGKYEVHKSSRHFDGELCFGGGWFIVVAQLPTGQITNHYKEEDWDLFKIRETEKALFEFDGHTASDTLDRLKALKPSAMNGSAGVHWVKASERLPLHRAHWKTRKSGSRDNSFPVRKNGLYSVADIYDEAPVGEPSKMCLVINGKDHYEDEFHLIEWLDESVSSPSPQVSSAGVHWQPISVKPPEEKQVLFDAVEDPPVWGKYRRKGKFDYVITQDSSGEENYHALSDYSRWLDESVSSPSPLEAETADKKNKQS